MGTSYRATSRRAGAVAVMLGAGSIALAAWATPNAAAQEAPSYAEWTGDGTTDGKCDVETNGPRGWTFLLTEAAAPFGIELTATFEGAGELRADGVEAGGGAFRFFVAADPDDTLLSAAAGPAADGAELIVERCTDGSEPFPRSGNQLTIAKEVSGTPAQQAARYDVEVVCDVAWELGSVWEDVDHPLNLSTDDDPPVVDSTDDTVLELSLTDGESVTISNIRPGAACAVIETASGGATVAYEDDEAGDEDGERDVRFPDNGTGERTVTITNRFPAVGGVVPVVTTTTTTAPSTTTTTVAPTTTTGPPASVAGVVVEATTTTAPTAVRGVALARTGSTTGSLALAGGALVALGAAVVLGNRRRTTG